MASRVELLVVGAGIAGASLAAAIAGRRSLLIVEAEAQPGYHSTGRSAAFWHEGYGGPLIAPLSRASLPVLEAGGYLARRGAIHLARAGEPIDLVDGSTATPLGRAELQGRLPGLRPEWTHGAEEPSLADIDVGKLHGDLLAAVRRSGGQIRTGARLSKAERLSGGGWSVWFEDGSTVEADCIVDAAGAWGDAVAEACDIAPLGLTPKRRTMVQLRVGRSGLRTLPLIVGADASFYFKGEGDRSIWLSPHDEIDCTACDAAPEELDVALAIDRFQKVVDWPVEAVERRWAGLRTFTPDRVPAIGFAPRHHDFFWCVGQGGFGIQTAPAAGQLGAAVLLGEGQVPKGVDPTVYDPARFA